MAKGRKKAKKQAAASGRLVLTYPHLPGAQAAAAYLALGRADAAVLVSSSARMARTMPALTEDPPAELHIIGLGVARGEEAVAGALDALGKAGTSIVWYYNAGEYLDFMGEAIERNGKFVREPGGDLVEMVVGQLAPRRQEAARDGLPAAVTADADAEVEGLELVKAALARYFKFRDYETYRAAIRKLAGVLPMTAADRIEIDVYRKWGLDYLAGKSDAMKTVRGLVQRAGADHFSTVLIEGETGTGKEIAASLIHQASARRLEPLLAVNCANFSRELLDSMLFGHEKGAFTHAVAQRTGCFEEANGGTVFLDEIGEMPIDLQAKLLRVLDSRSFRRIGGSQDIRVDVRIIAATNRDLLGRAEEGKFRRDLFYRLNVFPISMPPLRERPEDIVSTAIHFMYLEAQARGLAVSNPSREEQKALESYDWPGNCRELRNMVQRVVAGFAGDLVEAIEQERARRSRAASSGTENRVLAAPACEAHVRRIDDVRNEYARLAVEACGGNKSAAAKALKISPTTLGKYLKGE